MTTTAHEQRIADLLAWAAEEGIALPLPPATIIALEDAGAVVDLVSGAITPGAASHRYGLTPSGEALAIIAKEGFLDD